MQRQVVDARRIMQHQDLQVPPVGLAALLVGLHPPPAFQRLQRRARQAEAARTDDHQPRDAVVPQLGQMPGNHAAEGEAGEGDVPVARKHAVESLGQGAGETVGVVGVGRRGGFAVSRHVRHGEPMPFGQELDVADPVRP
jgi:hypothetical protein